MSKVLSGATPALFRKTSPSTFFTMLTFSQILNIYLQWMTALSPAIVCKVESERPTYGKSSCQYNHDMAPRCTLIIPYRLSIMAQFSCQSQCVIWQGVREGLRLLLRRWNYKKAGVLWVISVHMSVICEIQMLSCLWCKSLLDVLGTGGFFFFSLNVFVCERKI